MSRHPASKPAPNLSRDVLYQGQWLRLVRIGHWESCERVHGQGMAVIVIAVTDDDHVLFVEQFRIPLGAPTIEMPAGLVGDESDDDTLEAAATRELIEETGYAPDKVKVLLVGPTSAGMTNEQVAFVRATGLRQVSQGGGVDGENITVHKVPRGEAPAWLMQKQAQGYALDLKLWAGLWMIDHNPDGSLA